MSPPAVNAGTRGCVSAPVMTMQPISSSSLAQRTASCQLFGKLPVHRVQHLGPVHGEKGHVPHFFPATLATAFEPGYSFLVIQNVLVSPLKTPLL